MRGGAKPEGCCGTLEKESSTDIFVNSARNLKYLCETWQPLLANDELFIDAETLRASKILIIRSVCRATQIISEARAQELRLSGKWQVKSVEWRVERVRHLSSSQIKVDAQ